MRSQPSASHQPFVILAAVLAGVAYTLSPLTVVCLIWMAGLFRWTARDIDGRERHWLLAALGAALALRMMAIGVLPFLVDPQRQSYTSYFGDAQYAIQRSIWIRNIFLGIPVGSRDYIEAFEPQFGWSAYNYVLAFLHVLFGRSPYGVAVFSAALFLTAASLLYRCCRRAFGPLAAFAGLAGVLFMPSVFAWSVVPLKEAMQFLLLTTAVVASVGVVQGRWPVKVSSVAALAFAIAMSGTLRSGAAAIAAAGAGAGAVLWATTRRTALVAVTFVLVACGVAVGARTVYVQKALAAGVRDAAIRHLGHARSPGAYYRLVDDKYYAGVSTDPVDGPPFALTPGEGTRFLIRSVVMFFAQPLPWAADSMKWLALIPQQVLWYGAVLLAIAGGIRGMWRQPLLASVLAGMIAAGVVVVAPNSGNIGTLIRHRDMIVPFVLVLAGFGGVTVAGRFVALPARPRPEKVVASWR
ncbi:MAG: hypothetical protein HY048_15970 [Acidobacteria bacterium]|nr:hypothetical protein [Acidobacteriota bacterium]